MSRRSAWVSRPLGHSWNRTGLSLLLAALTAVGTLGAGAAQAQGRGRAAAAGRPQMMHPPMDARAEAPFDPTGYWVSLITEAWRFRMVVPARGNYDEYPLNLAAKHFADAWSPAAYEASGQQCKAYGAPILLWLPERLHISWADANTLRVDTDAGMQTRLLRFKPTAQDMAQPPSLQGLTVAKWVIHRAGFGPPPPHMPRYGYIKTHTDHLVQGLMRKNGLPYSDKTTTTEYWEQHTAPDGTTWLMVTTKVTDPVYLADPYFFTPNFKKEPNGAGWHPTACSLRY
ncbi:MAG: hypothetical protein ACREPS_02770 [Rhodanobacteraceae bacterium]